MWRPVQFFMRQSGEISFSLVFFKAINFVLPISSVCLLACSHWLILSVPALIFHGFYEISNNCNVLMVVSSAYSEKWKWVLQLRISFIYMINNKGSSMDPCGTLYWWSICRRNFHSFEHIVFCVWGNLKTVPLQILLCPNIPTCAIKFHDQ